MSLCDDEALQAELLRRYEDLITAEHRFMPRFMETVGISILPMVDGQILARCLLRLFDVDTSVGQQLDFVGQWIGCTRDVKIPIDQWFTLDDPGLGLDVGLWYHPFAERYRVHTLSDDDYRRLLRAKICANQWDGTLPGAYRCWDWLWQGTGYEVLIQDGLGGRPHEREKVYFQAGVSRAGDPLVQMVDVDAAKWDAPGRLEAASIWDRGDSPWDVPFGPHEGQSLWDVGMKGWRAVHGNMKLLVALVGPPLDAVTRAIFAESCVAFGLKSAGVGVSYLIQNQPGDLGPSTVNTPFFAFNCGPETPPPEGATWPPIPLAGFNMGGWAMPWRSRELLSDQP